MGNTITYVTVIWRVYYATVLLNTKWKKINRHYPDLCDMSWEINCRDQVAAIYMNQQNQPPFSSSYGCYIYIFTRDCMAVTYRFTRENSWFQQQLQIFIKDMVLPGVSQITRLLCLISIRNQFNIDASDQYRIDINPCSHAIWDVALHSRALP